MAWTRTNGSTPSSPEGFWPNPQKEKFFRKQAPWRYSKNRNTQGILCSYDWSTQSFNYYKGAEVTTYNKFELLTEEENLQTSNPYDDQIVPAEDGIILPHYVSLESFLQTDSILYDQNYYLYDKNKNFCSGYFPDFITLDIDKYNKISQNTNPENIFNNHYLKTKGNMYVKQIINKNSRYNFEYFNNLRSNYQIYDTVLPQLYSNSVSDHIYNPQPGTLTLESNQGVVIKNSKSGNKKVSSGGSNPHSSIKNLYPQAGITGNNPLPKKHHSVSKLKSDKKHHLCTQSATPCNKNINKPRVKLFDNVEVDKVEIELVPKQANLEFLLINSLVINVIKVQAIVEKFIKNKDYKSIFCMTEDDF